jgi:hypothetical protein
MIIFGVISVDDKLPDVVNITADHNSPSILSQLFGNLSFRLYILLSCKMIV